VDLYSAFIVVPHTQGAQVRITQCYLQITPYLPLPRKRSPDGASPDRLRTSNCSLLLIYLPPKGWIAESAWLADLQRTVYSHKWSPVSCRSSAGQQKFACQRPTFYHCATQPTDQGESTPVWTSAKPKLDFSESPTVYRGKHIMCQ